MIHDVNSRVVASTQSFKYPHKYQYLSLKYQYQYQYSCLKYKYKYQYFGSKYQYQYKYLKMVLKYRSSTSTSTQYYNPGEFGIFARPVGVRLRKSAQLHARLQRRRRKPRLRRSTLPSPVHESSYWTSTDVYETSHNRHHTHTHRGTLFATTARSLYPSDYTCTLWQRRFDMRFACARKRTDVASKSQYSLSEQTQLRFALVSNPASPLW